MRVVRESPLRTLITIAAEVTAEIQLSSGYVGGYSKTYISRPDPISLLYEGKTPIIVRFLFIGL
jgi:hypothetical protein